MKPLQIGYLLRSETTGFVAGCAVSQLELPELGALISAPLGHEYQVFGLIHDIHIDDDLIFINRHVDTLSAFAR